MDEVYNFGIKGDAGQHVTYLCKASLGDHKTIRCPRCNLEFSSLTKLYRHKVQCNTVRLPKCFCWSCKRSFQFRSLLLRHHCSKLYQRRQHNKKLLRKNLAVAKGWVEEQKKRQAESNENKDLFSDSSNSSSSNVGNASFMTCTKCKAKFSSVKHFQLHLMHGLCQSEPSNCTICGREFDDREELEFHQICCKEKKLMFDRLQEKYQKLKRLQHEQNIQRSFSCRSCKKHYPSPQLLKKHLQKHPYCTRLHNLKIKLRCLWERGEDLTQTARKSVPNSTNRKLGSIPVLKRLKTLPKRNWEVESSTSSENYENTVVGAARKSFRGMSQVNEAGSFCDICYRYFSSSVALKMHKEKHYEMEKQPSASKCPQCLESFHDSLSLFAHQNTLDHWGKATKSISTSCTCPFCGKDFLLVQSRNAHLRTHVDAHSEEVKEFLKETTCNICSQIFANEAAKIQHVKIKHNNQLLSDSENKAEKKSGDFSPEIMFQSHKYVGYSNKKVFLNITPTVSNQLKSNPTQCPICLKTYSTSFIRNRHFRTHTLDQAFECKFCPTKFPRSDRLTQHMQQQHNDCLGYECKECGSRFTTRMRALQHGNKAHPHLPAKTLIRERNVFISSLHKKYSKYASALTAASSNETVIPDEEFYCDVCELSFLKLCGLQRHRQSKLHREILQKSQVSVKQSNQEQTALEQRPPLSQTPPFIDYSKKFSCSTCSMKFDSVNDFVPHRLSHFSLQNYGEKVNELNPYTCEICGKVMDNIQKIQLHLFWHLQDVQLQAGPKKHTGSKNSLSDIPSILNRQPIAKKSINKVGNKQQELIIAGVKKPLFTCDACNIGFTTKQHYSIHIEQYCKARNPVSESEQPKVASGSPVNIPEKATGKSCITAGFCKICGCIFSSSTLYEDHKTLFCNKHSYTPLNENAESLYTEMVKSLMKLDSMVAGCVRCNIAFDSMETLSEHSNKHTLNSSLTAEVVDDNTESHDLNGNHNIECISEDHDLIVDSCNMADLPAVDDQNESTVLQDGDMVPKSPSVNNSLNSGTDQEVTMENSNDVSENTAESTDTIESLRNNFSRLLCVLVSDQELMEQLGYGKRPIDDVLINVLDQMGLVPVQENEVCSQLDRLRQNIRILLDVCIKDQIMELIADSQTTTDSIVVAALKMFGVEDLPSDLVAEQ